MVLPNHFQISTDFLQIWIISQMSIMKKRTISEEFRDGQTPENLSKDTLDIYEELEALPEAVWGVDYHKNWSKSRQISFTWLGNRVYCSMCVMCVLSSPKPLPSWGSLFHGFPDRNQNKDSTFKNIQYPFLSHKYANFFRQIDWWYGFCSRLGISRELYMEKIREIVVRTLWLCFD